MEMSQPHVIIHTSNVSCFTAFPYSKPYYGSSVPTYLSTGMSARESLVALWNQSFSRKAFLIRLSLMPVNSWVWRNGIKLRVYRIAAGTFCMVLLVLGRVSDLGFIRPAVTHPWNPPASTVYALVWNQNLWSTCTHVSFLVLRRLENWNSKFIRCHLHPARECPFIWFYSRLFFNFRSILEWTIHFSLRRSGVYPNDRSSCWKTLTVHFLESTKAIQQIQPACMAWPQNVMSHYPVYSMSSMV